LRLDFEVKLQAPVANRNKEPVRYSIMRRIFKVFMDMLMLQRT
jgi:hypothetical protein